jgi:hypothetical protein
MSSTLDKDRVLYKTIPDFFCLWCMQLEIAILEQKLKEFQRLFNLIIKK